ncbi:hypothetical protein [Streptomyces justiciae]|uniref:Integrase n=1 Tax=Streptomyces justiciae TaxID=2780140 RepID=A0ABU3LK27_9ACTN|nr:hypothetical protein [Streptomyces justiciae]MDT7839596.1 hypothetical protein [Streptomyces justiciae]
MAAATQLAIDLPVGPSEPAAALVRGEPGPDPTDVTPATTTCPGQKPLFAMRRDWSPLLARLRSRPWPDLPLTGAAAALLEDFAEQRRDQRKSGLRKNLRTLAILGYWLGADNAFHECDIHDLARLDGHLAAKPVCQFLRARGLLIDDSRLHRDRDLVWIEKVLNTIPQGVGEETATWVKVLRDQGRREGEPRSWDGIRRFLTYLRPALIAWTSDGMTSLRDVTTDHLQDALADLDGAHRRLLATAPAQSVQGPQARAAGLPRHRPQPARGRPDGHPTPGPLGLTCRPAWSNHHPDGAALHRLGRRPRSPRLGDPHRADSRSEPARGTLALRHGLRRHTLQLEDLTHRLAADWLTYRQQRWPASTNPHLSVTQKTALDPEHPPVHRTPMQGVLPPGQ